MMNFSEAARQITGSEWRATSGALRARGGMGRAGGLSRGVWLSAAAGLAAGLTLAAPARAQIDVRSQVVATGLSQPVAAIAPPGDTGRLFIVEQTGQVRILNLAGNTINATAFINVGPTGLNLTSASGERGLLGLTFHPNFNSNGYFYLSYTDISSGASVLRRFTANAPTPGNFAGAVTANTGTGVEILRIARTASNHNGGTVAFGPDGYLYWGMGDSGGGGDPENVAQNLNELRGKMLRLDVNGDAFPADPNLNYAIPPTNPFAGPTAGRDEIWAYGLRNPWKWSFDRVTGDLWIGDVGQDAREEVNFEPAGLGGRNYGWDCREGLIAFSGCLGTFTDPIIDFVNGSGTNAVCSITGGFVYRGSAIPALTGKYLVADYCADWIYALTYSGSGTPLVEDLTGKLSTAGGAIADIVSFAQDGAGELYVLSITGTMYKIVPDDGNCGCPCALSGPQGEILTDDFETDKGWTVTGVIGGAWTRGVPVNSPTDNNDPTSDSDGSGRAVVTGSTPNVDVDAGATNLISPALDFTKGEITLCYHYFLNTNATQAGDGLFVEVSSNGTAGPWIRVRSHTTDNGLRWTRTTISDSELLSAGVTYTNNMRVRFVANDGGADSTVEAAIDAIAFLTGNPFPDCNANGVDDAQDISGGTSADCNGNGVPDECDIAAGAFDFDGGPVGVRSAGATFFNTSCFGCHGSNGTGATGPNIRNKDRVTITKRLTLQVPHPGGAFPNLTQQDAANLEAFLADGGSKGRPDGVPDACQTLADCDNDGQSDGRELQLGTQVDADYDGIPDSCECPADLTGDGFVDDTDFVLFAQAYDQFTVPPADAGADLNGDTFVDDTDFVLFAQAYDGFVCP